MSDWTGMRLEEEGIARLQKFAIGAQKETGEAAEANPIR